MSTTKKVKKELSPQQLKVRNILGWVATGLCIALIVASLIISIVTIGNASKDDGKLRGIGGNVFMPVQTDSMEPTFKAGDLIITKIYDGDGTDLQVGQVVTYTKYVNAGGSLVEIYVTHRISDIGEVNGKLAFTVVGDNPNPQDGASGRETITWDKVVATWGTPAEKNADGTFNVTKDTKGGNMGVIGALINAIKNDKTVYFLVVVLPLIIIFLIYVFVLVRSLVIEKIAKTKEEALASAGVDGLSEEDKRRLAEEYLAQLARENAAKEESAPAEENTDKGEEQA